MVDGGKTNSPEPKASRPDMAGYGVPESLEGVLPWEWAHERLSKAHNYWLTTVRPMACHTQWWSGESGSAAHTTTAQAPLLAKRVTFSRIQTALSATRTRKKLSSLKASHAS